MDSDTAMCHMALTLDHIELIIREALMRLSGPYSEPLALISERKGYTDGSRRAWWRNES